MPLISVSRSNFRSPKMNTEAAVHPRALKDCTKRVTNPTVSPSNRLIVADHRREPGTRRTNSETGGREQAYVCRVLSLAPLLTLQARVETAGVGCRDCHLPARTQETAQLCQCGDGIVEVLDDLDEEYPVEGTRLQDGALANPVNTRNSWVIAVRFESRHLGSTRSQLSRDGAGARTVVENPETLCASLNEGTQQLAGNPLVRGSDRMGGRLWHTPCCRIFRRQLCLRDLTIPGSACAAAEEVCR
jgi:hypothetical protein